MDLEISKEIMEIPRVFSYKRVSNIKQVKGTGFERQANYADELAAKLGIPLDTELVLDDKGRSAFHQEHITKGHLGKFILAIRGGKIPLGSYFVIEDWDRFSRAAPLIALEQLKKVVEAGITVVTAKDGRHYTMASLSTNDLMYAIFPMILAHEESVKKSRHVSDALNIRAEWHKDGKRLFRSGKNPRWVKWNPITEQYDLIPGAVAGIRHAAKLYVQNYGFPTIMRELKELGYFEYLGSNIASAPSMLTRVLQSPTILGVRRFNILGNQFELENVYPPIFTKEEAEEIQRAIACRKAHPKAAHIESKVPPLFTGLKLAYCGYCGKTIISLNNRPIRNKADIGKPCHERREYRRLRCATYGTANQCFEKTHTGTAQVEKALLDYCCDQQNLSALLENDDRVPELRRTLAGLYTHIEELREQQAKLMEASLKWDGQFDDMFAAKALSLKNDLNAAEEKRRVVSLDLATVTSTKLITDAEAWQEIREQILSGDYDARMRCRKMILETFNRIVLYTRGFPHDLKSKVVCMMLVSKTGQEKLVAFDRDTGDLIERFEIPTPTFSIPKSVAE
jgi:hypothetical protein